MKFTGLVILVLIFTGQLFAQSSEEAVNLTYDTQGFGMRAAAMGNAYEGVADDYSAIFWNPAGLTQMHKGELYTSLYNFTFKNDATFLKNETKGQNDFTRFGSLGLVYPFPVTRGSLVLAFGYQKIKDLSNYVEFSGLMKGSNDLFFNISNDLCNCDSLYFDRDLGQKMNIISDGNLRQWSAAAAMELSPKFSAGITINYIGGKNEYNWEYLQTDPNSKNSYDILDQNHNKTKEFYYDSYAIKQNISSDYSGFQARLGGLFRLNKHLRFGGAITLPMTINVKETWSMSDNLQYEIAVLKENTTYQYGDKMNLDSGNFDYNIKIPFKFSGGLSYKNDRFLLSASGKYCDWTQMKFAMPDNRSSSDYEDLLNQNKNFNQDFRSVFSYALGGEFYLLHGLITLRGGYRYLPNPLKNVSSSLDRKYYSAGLGLRIDENTLAEASYTIGSWESSKYYDYGYGDWYPPELESYEKYTTSKLQVGLRLSF